MNDEIPCDTCPNKEPCEETGQECRAFRNWAATARYSEDDMQKYIRKVT